MDLVRARLRRLSLRSLPERLGRSAAVPAPDGHPQCQAGGWSTPRVPALCRSQPAGDSGDTVRQFITIDEVMATPRVDGRADRGRSPDTREAGGLTVRHGVRSDVDYPLSPPPPQWSTPSHRQRVHPPPSILTATPQYVSQRHISPRRGPPRHVSPPRVSRWHASPHVSARKGPAAPVSVIEFYGCHGSTGHRPRLGMHGGPPRNTRPPPHKEAAPETRQV